MFGSHLVILPDPSIATVDELLPLTNFAREDALHGLTRHIIQKLAKSVGIKVRLSVFSSCHICAD